MSHIIERDFRGVDLNLLVTFLVLMRERSVSRAAGKLFLGQPAVSGALARLREVFADELFVRTARGMVPTERALALAHALAPALDTVHGVLTASPSFVPATAERVFTLGIPDWLEMWLMPALLARLALLAPQVRVAAKSLDKLRAKPMLERDEMDLGVLASAGEPAPWQRSVALLQMNYSCVCHPDQLKLPDRRLTLARYLRHPHLFLSHRGDFDGLVDARLAELGQRRQVVYSTQHFASLPWLLSSLPALATVPQSLALQWQRCFGLQVMPVPVALPSFSIDMVWHAKRDGDAALQWLRGLVQEIVQAGAPGGVPAHQAARRR